MDGFYGSLLMIDLSQKSFRIEPVADEINAKYLGGKGLAAHLLSELNPLIDELCNLFIQRRILS